MSRPASNYARGLLFLLLLALPLAGCLDYELDLQLNQDGQGQLSARLDLPQGLSLDLPREQLQTISEPEPQRQEKQAGSRLVLSEQVSFESLSQLVARRVRFQVEQLDMGLPWQGKAKYRLTAWLLTGPKERRDRAVPQGGELEERRPDPPPRDPGELRARQLRAQALGQHQITLKVSLPGKVYKARSLVLGSSRIKPSLSPDGEAVTWQVPLKVLVNENVRYTLIFSLDFEGQFQGVGGQASSRLYGQASQPKPGEAKPGEEGEKGSGPPAAEQPQKDLEE